MEKADSKDEMATKEKVPIWRLFFLCGSGGALNIGYAVVGAYAIPLMQAAGIPLRYASLILAISPVLGLLFQPFLGALSDECRCWWGRRRPFILVLLLLAVIGFGVAPYVFFLHDLNIDHDDLYIKIGVVVCVVLFDFSLGALQLPARAYLLDVTPTSQSQTGNFIFSLLVAVFAALGFALGAIDWASIAHREVTIRTQSEIVFGATAVIIFILMIMTLISVKEVPYSPESQKKIEDVHRTLLPSLSGSINNIPEEPIKDATESKNHATCCTCDILEMFKDSLTELVSFTYHMSYHMWLVWLMTLTAFVGEFTYALGFTTFVGTVIYKGDPQANPDSQLYSLYTQGVRMGSLALTISSIVSAVLSLCLDYITKWIRLKTLYLFIFAYFVLCSFLMILLQETYIVLVFGACYGPYLVILLTVPFALLPIYRVRGMI